MHDEAPASTHKRINGSTRFGANTSDGPDFGSFRAQGFHVDAQIRVDAKTAMKCDGHLARLGVAIEITLHHHLRRDHPGLITPSRIRQDGSIYSLVVLLRNESVLPCRL
ncbi:hypothetical protein HK414_24200 [Ramlibacter terrae]|uniref:Uncharacterized protein n=1 Tax=Ramlibacter terrae TaxID=2732511 RepID=A0ABX6P5L7_9BURK|nr:hypothetical protein HK414_24200 [Ramlibacter terrae]